MIKKICGWCKKEFMIYPSQKHIQCCSLKCGYKLRDSKATKSAIGRAAAVMYKNKISKIKR